MPQIVSWARDLLISRGALVETENGDALRAMLSPEVSGAIGAGEWLSLRFGAGAGSDDETEWLERLAALLPRDARVSGARQRQTKILPRIDAAAVLDRELALQNGIFRLPEESQAAARYYFFTLHYQIESDETSLGLWTGCLNASARSVVSRPDALLHFVRDELEEEPAFAIRRDELNELFPLAVRAAQPEIRGLAGGVEESSNRRLARDTDRINAYYGKLQGQIAKRAAKRGGDDKERGRAEATELDRLAKLEDLARKYSLKISAEPGDVLVLTLPVRQIKARVIRKKAERAAVFHFNPVLGELENPWCEGCGCRAHPLYLCDDRVHFLCRDCYRPCRACKP